MLQQLRSSLRPPQRPLHSARQRQRQPLSLLRPRRGHRPLGSLHHALLSKPPPVRIGNQIVMNSVLTGRAIVIDAAVEAAVAQPLHESVRAAAERAAEQEATAGRRQPGIEQTWCGMDVTEMMPLFEQKEKTAAGAGDDDSSDDEDGEDEDEDGEDEDEDEDDPLADLEVDDNEEGGGSVSCFAHV